MPDAPPADSFTFRYAVTAADARAAAWLAWSDGAPVLVGLGLLTVLCATWSPLAFAGRAAAVVIPVLVVLVALYYRNRIDSAVALQAGNQIVVIVSPAGLRMEGRLGASEFPWTTVERIRRGRSVWILELRGGARRTYFPTAAIPELARAPIVRWAGANGVRLA